MTGKDGKAAAEEKIYDFSKKDPNAVLTQNEFDHFEEGMNITNTSTPADQIDMKKAVQSVTRDLNRLFP